MRAPVVSVLLPAYDAAATLPLALASIARQSEDRWECVLVDDGSRDATREIALSAARHDARVRVVTIAHGGIVAALGAGLSRCRARYVARMDADDVMHRERLERQVAALDADPALGAVGCHVRMFPRRDLPGGLRDYERWLASIDSAERVRVEAFVECPVAHPTWVVRRELLLRFGYRDQGWPEDYDLLLRFVAAGVRFGVVPRRLLGWRDSPGRSWRTAAACDRDRIVACKAAFLAESWLGTRREYVLWGYGGTGKALRRALAAHGKNPSHVVEVHPGRVGQRIHGAPVISPAALAAVKGCRVIVSVAGVAAREEIRGLLRALGLVETVDFVCAA